MTGSKNQGGRRVGEGRDGSRLFPDSGRGVPGGPDPNDDGDPDTDSDRKY